MRTECTFCGLSTQRKTGIHKECEAVLATPRGKLSQRIKFLTLRLVTCDLNDFHKVQGELLNARKELEAK